MNFRRLIPLLSGLLMLFLCFSLLTAEAAAKSADLALGYGVSAEPFHESEPNNATSTAHRVQAGTLILGQTSRSDPRDYYQFTLPRRSEIAFFSACSSSNVQFRLLTQEGEPLAYSSYYGVEQSFRIDGIEGTLEGGTYYLMVEEQGLPVYSTPVDYLLEFHVHDFTAAETEPATCIAEGIRVSACGCYEELPLTDHSYETGIPVPPSCTEYGYTSYTCTHCGHVTLEDFSQPPLGHEIDPATLEQDTANRSHSYTCRRCGSYVAEVCTFQETAGEYCCIYCGASAGSSVFRISGRTRIETSLAIANALKQQLEVSKFHTVVVASSQNFPDALTGSYLAVRSQAPILLTNPDTHMQVVTYIQRNIAPDGIVYILGGEGAVDSSFEVLLSQLGIPSIRLSGPTRLDTNLKILLEAGVEPGEDVLICTAYGFADSLSASASGKPILLVSSTLTDAQKSFLSTVQGDLILIGGTAAVSEELEAELSAYGNTRRISGRSRYETSVLVAEAFFSAPSRAVMAYARNYPDGLCGGPLAAAMGAPLILTDGNISPAADYTRRHHICHGYVLGGAALIDDAAVRTGFHLPDQTHIPVLR